MTEREAMKVKTWREVDALVAERIFGLKVVSHDWPCGYTMDDGTYEAASRNDGGQSGWFNERGPVFLPEGGSWPPAKLAKSGQWAAYDYEYAQVEPVAHYSDDWVVMGWLIDAMFGRWCRVNLQQLNSGKWTAGFFTPVPQLPRNRISATAPQAVCLAALAAVGIDVEVEE